MSRRFPLLDSMLLFVVAASALAIVGIFVLRSAVRAAEQARWEAHAREVPGSEASGDDPLPAGGDGIWIVAGLTAAALAGAGAYAIARTVRSGRDRQLGELAEAMDDTGLLAGDGFLRRRDAEALGETALAFARMQRRLREGAEGLVQDRDRLRAVLGAMSEGVLAVDAERRALLANGSFRRMFDLETTVFEDRDYKEVVRHRAIHETIEKILREGGASAVEIELPGHSRRALAVAVGALETGEPDANDSSPREAGANDPARRGAVAVFRDVTELRRLERLRHEFVANVSHELKTPLASIRAYAETLRLWAHEDPARVDLLCSRIEEAVDRLNALVLDMLQIARIESGEQTFEIVAVDVNAEVEACVARFAERAAVKRIVLSAELFPGGGLYVRADEPGLRTALDNLVDNAVKYTPANGAVVVRSRVERDQIAIDVQDDGIGIAPVHQARIFERFYRVDDARSRDEGGTGLGLSIVKRLIQAFGGTVSVQSASGRGTTFTIRLPRTAEAPSS